MIIDPRKVNLAEADIEEYLWQYPSTLEMQAWLKRQYRVPSGIIDLFGIHEYGTPSIVEVKNVEVDGNAVAQIQRYAFDIQQIIGKATRWAIVDPTMEGNIHKVIVGPSINKQAMHECEACCISYIQFDIALHLQTSKPRWNQEYRRKREEIWSSLAIESDIASAPWYQYDLGQDSDAELDTSTEDQSILRSVDEYLGQIPADGQSDEDSA